MLKDRRAAYVETLSPGDITGYLTVSASAICQECIHSPAVSLGEWGGGVQTQKLEKKMKMAVKSLADLTSEEWSRKTSKHLGELR